MRLHTACQTRRSQTPRRRRGATAARRGLTIRLKLTLWYGALFLLAGVLLIAVNFFMVRDSLTPAPEKARAAVAERFGIPPEAAGIRRRVPGPARATTCTAT